MPHGLFREPLLQSKTGQNAGWLLVASLIFGFLGARLIIEHFFPFDYQKDRIQWVGPTQIAYQNNKQNIDLLLLGSSRIYRGVEPQTLVRELQQNGVSVTPFNHAWPNQNLLEIQHILSQLPKNTLRYIVFEPAMFSQWVIDNSKSLRAQVFFTPSNSLDNTRMLLCSPVSRKKRWQGIYYTWVATAGQLSGLGRLNTWLREIPTPQPANPMGYRPLDEETEQRFIERKNDFLQQQKSYQKRLQRLPKRKAKKISACQLAALQQTIEHIKTLGAKPILLIPPTVKVAREYKGLRRHLSKKSWPFLAYDDPQRYPGLYQSEHRFDVEHLNAKGSRIWSKQLGTDLATLMQGD